MQCNKGYRCVYSLNIHLVLVTKYRRKVINQEILLRLHEILAGTCEKWNRKLTDFNGESDHVHLVIDFPPDVEISKLVNNLKTVSSRLIRKEFTDVVSLIYSKPVFWTGAYFVASCGGVTLDQVRKYVENQSEIAE
ncbi:IS200/IS605 family transposase [Microseira wollei]|uniref:ISSoc3, orfA transposase n=1 Tax=Microseira wollei NIES-4236 TaxID=2530354 RepID=A0AAV3XAM7_9CYAN|nr:ISSoc3, orfA transposase [Microseira wollei NIES-4236]